MHSTQISQRLESKNISNQGFTFLELAIVLTIIGILSGLLFALINPIYENAKLVETQEKLQKIAEAINAYAVNNNRIPCPTVPDTTTTNPGFGYEAGSGADGGLIPTPGCPTVAGQMPNGVNFNAKPYNGPYRNGIVPFKTLGLQESMVRDGWGNYFTYAIDPTYASNTKLAFYPSPPAASDDILKPVHAACRTREWMDETGMRAVDIDGDTIEDDTRAILSNRNGEKARFCCAAPLYTPGGTLISPLTVLDEEGDNMLAVARTAYVAAPADREDYDASHRYDTPDTIMKIYDPDDTDNELTPYEEEDDSPDVVFDAEKYFIQPQVPPADVRSTSVAYAIISHGPNGYGAYAPDSTSVQLSPELANGSAEAMNIFDYSTPPSLTTSATFTMDLDTLVDISAARTSLQAINEATAARQALAYDDVMVWFTQDAIYASQNRSCATP